MSTIMNGNDLNTLMQIMGSYGSSYFSGQHPDDFEFNEEALTELYNKLSSFTSNTEFDMQPINTLYNKVNKLREHLVTHKRINDTDIFEAEIDICNAIALAVTKDPDYKMSKSDANKLEWAAKATNFKL